MHTGCEEQGGPSGPVQNEEGSLLTEALVGLGMLGLVIASVATLVPAALDAEVRASAHRAALMVGDALLEAELAGVPPTAVPLAALPDPVRVVARVAHADEPYASHDVGCDAQQAPGPPHTTVRVDHGGRTDGRELVLSAGPRIATPSAEPSAALVLRTRDHSWAPHDALVLLGPDGEPLTSEGLGSGCATYGGIPPGTSWVTSAEGAPLLIDRLHVPLEQRPIPVSLDRREQDRVIDVAPAGRLRVVVDDGGARRPDHIVSGTLRWFVRGDDSNAGTSLGDARPVYPGVTTVVIPPCADANTIGSSGTVVVGAGKEVTLVVSLAVVTVEGIGDRSDTWLQLQRTAGCADGTALRPVLRFEGALHDGMRIALPRGEWDAWLRRPDAGVLTGSVRLVAVGSDGVVRIP